MDSNLESNARLKTLIQPIKDLAANWDIDIAESLGEYLEELSALRISLDGGNTQLNFAEAALLIQGSTTVYSKKVEYLHQLVLKSLEYITNNSKRTAAGAASANKRDKEGAEGAQSSGNNNNNSIDEDLLDFGRDPSFLLLDNVLEQGTNIDLKPTAVPEGRRASSLSASRPSVNGTNVSRVSISLMHSMLNDDQGTSVLKLASSFMDNNGALLLGGFRPSFAKPSAALDSALANISAIAAHDDDDLHNNNRLSLSFEHAHSPMQTQPLTQTQPLAHTPTRMPMHTHIDGDHWDAMDIDDHPPYDDLPPPAHTQTEMDSGAQIATQPLPLNAHTQETQAFASSTAIAAVNVNTNAHTTRTTRSATAAPLLQQRAYVLLDPHALVAGSRPARRGRPFRIPATLRGVSVSSNGNNSISNGKKKGREKEAVDPFKSVVDALEKERDSWQDFLSAKIPSRGLSDACLLPLLKLKRKLHRKRLQEAREKGDEEFLANQSLHRSLWDEPQALLDDVHATENALSLAAQRGRDGDVLYDTEAAMVAPTQEMDAFYGANDVDFDDYEPADFAGDREFVSTAPEAMPALQQQRESGEPAEDFVFSAEEQLREEEDLARRMEAALNADLHLSSSSQSYEMICKQYIDGFHRGANAFARETQLSKRVSEWTLRLEPLLQAQEDAPPFDIHEYSHRVLEKVDHVIAVNCDSRDPRKSLSAEKQQISFSDVVQGESSAEVCRVFLACLQLANLGNVMIEKRETDEQTNDFDVRLLTTSKQQDIEGFRAPSVQPTTTVDPAHADRENEEIQPTVDDERPAVPVKANAKTTRTRRAASKHATERIEALSAL